MDHISGGERAISMYRVVDDGGFLAILDPNAYTSFISETFSSYEVLRRHFLEEMQKGTILVWGTGVANKWRIDVRFEQSDVVGFRQVTGPLNVSDGFLCLSDYGTLFGAALNKAASLPPGNKRSLYIQLASGRYTCRVVQMFDPEDDDCSDGDHDFLIELYSQESSPEPWLEIPWRFGEA